VRGRTVSTLDGNARSWKDSIVRAAHDAGKAPEGALVTDMLFTFPTKDSKRWGQPHLFVPDKDNLEKLVLDAITQAGTWKDDSLVWAGSTRKVWCKPGQEGVKVVISQGGWTQSVQGTPSWIDQDGP